MTGDYTLLLLDEGKKQIKIASETLSIRLTYSSVASSLESLVFLVGEAKTDRNNASRDYLDLIFLNNNKHCMYDSAFVFMLLQAQMKVLQSSLAFIWQ